MAANKTQRNSRSGVPLTALLAAGSGEGEDASHPAAALLSPTTSLLLDSAVWRVTRLLELLCSVGEREAWARLVGGNDHLACRRLADFAAAGSAVLRLLLVLSRGAGGEDGAGFDGARCDVI